MQDPTRSIAPAQYAEAFASWQDDAPVPPVPGSTLTIPLVSLRSLSTVRQRIRGFLGTALETAGAPTAAEVAPDEPDAAIDEAVMVIDELASNALRHGAAPCSLHLCNGGSHWIVIVSDGAPDRRPTPASERPVGTGGYGLYLVADLSSAHGVHYEPDRKCVSACIDKSR